MKAIRLKEKGKEPMIFGTVTKLAEHFNIKQNEASHILSIIKKGTIYLMAQKLVN